jgi:predicted DNA-binding transcriptional regulator AlpA
MIDQALTERAEPKVTRLLGITDVAEALAISPQTITRMVRSGRFPKPIRLSGRCLRWSAAAIEEYLQTLQS